MNDYITDQYRCTNCGSLFDYKHTDILLKCPYCNSNHCLSENMKPRSSSEIFNEGLGRLQRKSNRKFNPKISAIVTVAAIFFAIIFISLSSRSMRNKVNHGSSSDTTAVKSVPAVLSYYRDDVDGFLLAIVEQTCYDDAVQLNVIAHFYNNGKEVYTSSCPARTQGKDDRKIVNLEKPTDVVYDTIKVTIDRTD